ncbi:hypothetical protein ACP70R_006054 [Stipagrostis hirtigluma subsp. patula]
MGMEGLVGFVYRAIKKRRARRRTMHYEFVSDSGSPPPSPERRLTGGDYSQPQSQSCRFAAARSLADELGLRRHDGAVRAPPEGLPEAPLRRSSTGAGCPGLGGFSSMRVLG